MEFIGTLATAVAVFCLLMALFGSRRTRMADRLDVARGAGLAGISRAQYERLVSAEAPVWERILAPLAGRLATRAPGAVSSVSDDLIVRAGYDPNVLTAAEVFAAKVLLGVSILAVGAVVAFAMPFPFFIQFMILSLVEGAAFVGFLLPSRYLEMRAASRQQQLRRELPDFLALVRPLAARQSLEQSMSQVADALHTASAGRNLLARQIHSAVAAYGFRDESTNLYKALADVAMVADVEEIKDLATSLEQAASFGKGVGDVLTETERYLREAERNRLAATASAISTKLTLTLVLCYLPEFMLLIVAPMFISTLSKL
jgi:pilus assembly protein TadC